MFGQTSSPEIQRLMHGVSRIAWRSALASRSASLCARGAMSGGAGVGEIGEQPTLWTEIEERPFSAA
jgi:hypothetical protein